MKWSDGYRMRFVLLGIMAVIVFVGGRAKADFTFGEPINMGPMFNTSFADSPDCFSSNGLVLYFESQNRPGGYGKWDIWVSTRETLDDPWGAPINLGPQVNTGQDDCGAYVSADGTELYFQSNRSGGYGGWDIWMTTKHFTDRNPDGYWSEPQNLGSLINSSNWEGTPWLSSDGLELYFYARNRTGGYGNGDIWISRRATKNDPWGEPTNLGPIVNSSAFDICPTLSPDGLLLFFSEDIIGSLRPGGFGSADMWMSRRASISDPWGTPVNLGPIVNSSSHDTGPRVSPDGSTLYFSSEKPGGFGGIYGDMYQAPIIPIVDLNADGIVDSADMCIIVDNWGTDNALCDIGPMPWGDGVVDVQDLIVLAEHLFEQVPPAQ